MSGKGFGYPGDKFGYLTLLEDSGERDNHGNVIWKCQCECGNIIYRTYSIIMNSVIRGYVISCGCKRSKEIGQKYAFDQNRIDKARKSLGQIDGTTMVGIGPQKIRKNNKSGVRGVCFKSREGKWQADVVLRGKSCERQYFKTKEEAIAWRRYLEEKYYEPIKEEYNEQKKN